MNKKDKIVLDIHKKYIGQLSSLLERGLMEHQTSYGDSIPVSKKLSKFIHKFRKENE